MYFITLCTQNRVHLFGEIYNDKMVSNDAGKNANSCWQNIPLHYPNVRLHEFIIMPNHIHGIIEIVGPENIQRAGNIRRAGNIPPLRSPLGNIVRGLKIGVTKWVQENKNCEIGTSIWQRNYWEHIIRNENEHQHIAQYITDNPQQWAMDKLNGGMGNRVMEPATT